MKANFTQLEAPERNYRNARQGPGLAAGRGFTLIESMLVLVVISLLMLIVWPVLASARQASARTTCSSNLRQIGLAFQMYFQDNGHYPHSLELTHGPWIKEKQILFCPQDREFVLQGAASSYIWKSMVPPTFQPLAGMQSVDSNVVLAACKHLTGQKLVANKDDSIHETEAAYPFRLVLRAGGAVQRVHLDEMRKLRVPGRTGYLECYPGEPGYRKSLEKL